MRFLAPTAPDDEESLLTRLRSGDEDDAHRALSEIITRYTDATERTVWRIVRDSDAVADITQAMWMTCWNTRKTLTVHQGLREYLICMARTRALNWTRGERRQQELARKVVDWQLADDYGIVENDAVHILGAEDQIRRLHAIMAEMPPRQRGVYELVMRDGYTHEQTAEFLDITPQTVSNHMWQANQYIRRRLSESAEDRIYA